MPPHELSTDDPHHRCPSQAPPIAGRRRVLPQTQTPRTQRSDADSQGGAALATHKLGVIEKGREPADPVEGRHHQEHNHHVSLRFDSVSLYIRC
ncbi:unnamed protein product [Linum trigynum]|uniref:Uncharacterized protein n=1 Tax=Linum trigynum TaxID=586398 RepID=A0AAV2F783_9ROSI